MRNTEKVKKIKTEILSVTTRLEYLTRKLRELIVSGDESDKGNNTYTLKKHSRKETKSGSQTNVKVRNVL